MSPNLPLLTRPVSPLPAGLPHPADGPVSRPRGTVRRHGRLVLILLVAVIVVDQAAKWWAWRHVSDAQMNAGGDILTGSALGTLYSGRISGAALDLMDFGLLSVAVSFLARFRVPAAVAVSGALMVGGWGSNLLDRLGLHYWTAPGSVRGAVDFIHVGTYIYNIADIFIGVGTPLFLLTAAYLGVRAVRRGRLPRPTKRRLLAQLRVPVLASTGLILVVALGAVNYGGLHTTPHRHPAPSAATSAALGSNG